MPSKRKAAAHPTDAELRGVAEQLAELAATLTAACATLQARHGATDSMAGVLRHAEGHVRTTAQVLGDDALPIRRALAEAAALGELPEAEDADQD